MQEIQIRDAIEGALRRVGNHSEARIGTIKELWPARWGIDVLDSVSGRRRTTVSLDVPDATSRDGIVELAGIEFQVWLKLCGLCQRPSYVTGEDSAARVIFFNCSHCGSYLISGDEVSNLRRMVARGDAETLRALPKLIGLVQERQGKSELPFIENSRADARE